MENSEHSPSSLLGAKVVHATLDALQQNGDSDNGDKQPGLSWTSPLVFSAGLNMLLRSPGNQMEVNDFLARLPRQIPEDASEALEVEPGWASERGYRTFYRAVKIGWLARSKGVWSLTAAGIDAVQETVVSKDLWRLAKDLSGSGETVESVLPIHGEVNNFGSIPQNLYSTNQSSVQQLVSQIEAGTLALPDIQRPFVWKNTKVRDLLDSMFRGFPFGYILTWRSPVEVQSKQIGTGKKGVTAPHALVIDGQQRLTSLFAVMTGNKVLDRNFKHKKVEISFHPIRGAFEVSSAALKKSPEWLPDVSEVFTDEMGAHSVIEDYLAQLERSRIVDPEHRVAIAQNIQRLVGMKSILLGVLEIAQDADEEQVAEIFVRINSKGQNLKQADFILTLLAVFWQEGRQQLETFAKECRIPRADGAASPFNRLLQPGADDMIRVVIALSHRRAKLASAYQVLRGKSATTRQITPEAREENLAILSEAQAKVLDSGSWNEFLKTLQAAGYRDKSMVPSMNAALMSYGLFLIGRHDYGLSVQELRRLIGKWFAFISVSGRYSTSPESAMEEDLARLRNVQNGEGFIKALEGAMETELTADFWSFTLPARLESSNIRTAYSFFAAQCRLDSKSLYSKLPVATLLDPERKATRKDLEIHHLFPKAWLKANGVTDQREFNQVANQTLIEWSVNSDISDKDPKEYAPEYDRITDTLTNQNHAMPDGWWNMEYADFLIERRKLMADVIRRAFESW